VKKMIDSLSFILPFIFLFAITYGGLEVANVFKNRKVNIVIALVISFFGISNYEIIELIWQIMPYTALLFIFVFFFAFVLKIVKGRGAKADTDVVIVILALALLFLYSASTSSLPYMLGIGDIFTDYRLLSLLAFILMILLFYYAYSKK